MTNAENIGAPAAKAVQKKAKSSSFYLAMRLMPAEERDAMFAIYAFCRKVDDIADDGVGTRAERHEKLEQWRADLRGEVIRNEAAVEQYRAANNLLSASGATLTEQEIFDIGVERHEVAESFKVGDASVICGNVQTANATVYIIDKVLVPAS